jgi:CRISPR-associated endonuclease Cas1
VNAATKADLDAADGALARTYGPSSDRTAATGVLVADGYQLTITVKNDLLRIEDGYGTHKRTRTIARHTREVKRIIVLGVAGTISLAALQWCNDAKITLAHLDGRGRVLTITRTHAHHDARLRRAQAIAYGTPTGNKIARHLIAAKLAGQAAILETRLNAPKIARMLFSYRDQILKSSDLETVRKLEALAASRYFAQWARAVNAQFAAADLPRVPSHWTVPNPRQSPLAVRTPRKAVDPVNAILNYAYSLGEVECVHACHLLGLDPELGILHTDRIRRDSMALDFIEPLRPVIDTVVLDLLAERCFRKVDFIAARDGTCRLTETLTHPLARHLSEWGNAIAPIAEDVAHSLTTNTTGAVIERTPLTQRRRHVAIARLSDSAGDRS